MAGKPRNKPSIQEQIESTKEGDEIKGEQEKTSYVINSNTKRLTITDQAIALSALDRISTIHDHPGSCSKNCPALIAKEALRKIRGQ